MRLKIGTDLRDVADVRFKQRADLRAVNIIIGKFGSELRVIWVRPISEPPTGWVFTQGRPISVSGRFIRLAGQV